MERHDPFTLVTVTAEWRDPLVSAPWWGFPALLVGIAVLLVAVAVLLISWSALARRAPRGRKTTARKTIIGLAVMSTLLLVAGAALTAGSVLRPEAMGTAVSETDRSQYVIASGTIGSAEQNGDGGVDVRLADDDSVPLRFTSIDRFDPPELVGAEGRSITVTCTVVDDEDALHCDFTTPHQRNEGARALFQHTHSKKAILDGRGPPADDVVITTEPYTDSD